MSVRLAVFAFAASILGTNAASAQTVDDLVGKWGLASYWKPEDAVKAPGWAKATCGSPYTITKSPAGNLMIHIADDPAQKEVKLSGKKLVPVDTKLAGGVAKHERTITKFDAGISFELTWSNPGVGSRYGINVYVKCGK